MTNNSGGALVAGDVCVQDTSADENVTTTTSAASTLKVFVAAESIASAAAGKFYESGYCPLVNVSASATRGYFLFTHTVAKQATTSTTYGTGAFGKILKAGTSPSAIIYSATAQTSGAGTIGGTTGSTDNAIIRADGTGGATLQSSLVTVNDSGTVNIPTGQTYNINNSPHTHAGSAPSHAYFTLLAAALEPLAYEQPQFNSISYAITTPAKILMMGWALRLGAAGRLDMRDHSRPLYLKNITITSVEANAVAAIIDPALATYTDAWTTYYDRLNSLATLDTKWHAFAGTATVFLPGPYGNIITHATQYGTAWMALLGWSTRTTWGWPLLPEIDDTNKSRQTRQYTLPIAKGITSGLFSAAADGSGGISYVICPSTWGKVTDPLTYTFREDFMGASLDTATIWTRAQGTVGNIEIDTNFAWCKCIGDNASWGPNGAYTQATFARSGQPYFVCDFVLAASQTFGFIVGFSDGGGQSYTNFAHGVLIQQTGIMKVYENGNDRGAVGSTIVAGLIYRLRIRALSGGGATYEIQGGDTAQRIGSGTWVSITPGTTTSATNTLHAGFAGAGGGTNYVGDVRVYV